MTIITVITPSPWSRGRCHYCCCTARTLWRLDDDTQVSAAADTNGRNDSRSHITCTFGCSINAQRCTTNYTDETFPKVSVSTGWEREKRLFVSFLVSVVHESRILYPPRVLEINRKQMFDHVSETSRKLWCFRSVRRGINAFDRNSPRHVFILVRRVQRYKLYWQFH